MKKSSLKKDLFAQLAIVAKSLSNANRLELLDLLAQGERSVDELAKASALSVANTSQHLQDLRRSGLVSNRSEGKKAIYRLSDYKVVELIGVMRNFAEGNLAEIQMLINNYLLSIDELEPLKRDELLQRVQYGEVIVVDVRPGIEYESGHLPNAINIPFSMLEDELKKLPKNKEIIAYCRGPYCLLSFDAVARLREKGFKARRLEDGFPEWKLSGLPVEQGI